MLNSGVIVCEEDQSTPVSPTSASNNRSLHVLPKATVRLLGSSQVITSVHSAVKELIENALDAQATTIDIKLEDFGLGKIEVRDNGCGIEEHQIKDVAKHYHTSKIKSFSDLHSLCTYGFRGEALGSLCSLSNLSITSKTESATVGVTVEVNSQGEVTHTKPSHFGRGTCIIATHLFKNLPVRKQFYSTVKKKKDELRQVEELVMSYGVIQPDLRISLRHGKDLLWQKFAVLDHRTVLLNILGTATFNQLEQKVTSSENPKMTIEAFLPKANSKTTLTSRSVNTRHLTFVNKRPVLMKDVDKLVRQHYMENHKTDEKGGNRYPIYFLSVSIPASDVDVNVEPNKTRVYLENQDVLLKLLTDLLEEHFGSNDLKPTAAIGKQTAEAKNIDNTHAQNNPEPDNDFDSITCSQFGSFELEAPILAESEQFLNSNQSSSISCVNDNDGNTAITDCSDKDSRLSHIGGDNSTNYKKGANSAEPPIRIDSDNLSSSNRNEISSLNSTNSLNEVSNNHAQSDFYFRTKSVGCEENSVTSLFKDNKTSQQLSQKEIAFQELMEDLDSEDLLCTFDENPPSVDSSLRGNIVLSKEPVSCEQWSRGTGLTDSSGNTLQGPSLLIAGGHHSADDECHQTLNSNGKRPQSIADDLDDGKPASKKSTRDTAETTMFDLISSQPVKRPQTAFIHFSKEVRPKVVKENPDLNFQDTARLIGQMWKGMSADEKEPYEKLTSLDVERYRKQVAAGSNSSVKGRRKQTSKRTSLSIKDCLLNMMSQVPLKSRRLSSTSPQVKTTTCHLDMNRLKRLYAQEFSHSQTQNTSKMNVIGCIKSHRSWIGCQGNQLYAINTSRIEESVLYQSLLESYVLKPIKLEVPIHLTDSCLNSSSYSTLVSMATERSKVLGGHNHIADERLTNNGFELTWTKDPSTGLRTFNVVGLCKSIPSYSISDLTELLEQMTESPAAGVAQCRPFKVINYLKSEAVRMVRNSPMKSQKEVVEELLDELTNQLSPNTDTCLHGQPFYYLIKDLNGLNLTLTQVTQH